MSVEDDQGHGRRNYQRRAEPDPQRRPWACKQWNAMTDSDRHALKEHLESFATTEDMITYKKYLRDWCEVPHDWLGIRPKF